MEDTLLQEAVAEAVQKRKFLKIQYVTELQEYLNVTALIKRTFDKEGETFLELATGEELAFGQPVKVGDVPSSKYNPRDFTCDC